MTAVEELLDENLLRTLVPFGDLDETQLKYLRSRYEIESFAPGKTIFEKGETDHKAYYLISGQVKLTYSSENVKLIFANSKESRYALAPVLPRKATATAKNAVCVLSIDMDLFKQVLDMGSNGYEVEEYQVDESDWMSAFLQSSVFVKLPATNIQALMMRMKEMPVKAGQVIIRQGNDDGSYYIVKQGRCRVVRKHSPQDEEVQLAVLGPGSGFGEEAIITHNRRGATVTMLEDGVLMHLSREDFDELLVEPLIAQKAYEEVAFNKETVFLDVRYYDDYIRNGITGSQFVILSELRAKLNELNRSKQYVVCSNTGSRASAAAFLLCQQGLNAVVLRFGLENLPATVKRGNGEAREPDDVSRSQVDDGIPVLKPINDPSTKEAMQNPKVKELFNKAQKRVNDNANRVSSAEKARKAAELEVVRLRKEAAKARSDAAQAKKQMQLVTQKGSMENEHLQAVRETARITELELGYKQAEMQQAIRQAQLQAKRTAEANESLQEAQQQIENLKHKMQTALHQAKEEAEAIRQFAAMEAKKQNEEIAKLEQREAQRARESQLAQQKAQQEIARLRSEMEQAKAQAGRVLEAENAREEAERRVKALQEEVAKQSYVHRSEIEHEVARARAVELANKQAEIEEAATIAQNQAYRAQQAEQSRLEAEAEINKLRQEVEQLRQQTNSGEKEKLLAMQSEMGQIARQAAEEAIRVREAEQAKLQAEAEIQRLKQEVKIVSEQAQAQLMVGVEKATQERHNSAEQFEQIQQNIREQTRKAANEELNRLKREMQQKLEAKAQKQRAQLEREKQRLRQQEEAARKELEAQKRRLRAEEAERRRQDVEKQRQLQARERQLMLEAQQAEQLRLEQEREARRLRDELNRKKAETTQKIHVGSKKNGGNRRSQEQEKTEIVTEDTSATEENGVDLDSSSLYVEMEAISQVIELDDEIDLDNVEGLEVSKSQQESNAWLSDQAMWETALGMGDDPEIEEVILQAPEERVNEPSFGEGPVFDEDEELPAWDNSFVASDDQLAQALADSYKVPSTQPRDVNPAEFFSQDVNPMVRSQPVDVRDALQQARNRAKVTKAVVATVALCICLAGGLYFYKSGGLAGLKSKVASVINKNETKAETKAETGAKVTKALGTTSAVENSTKVSTPVLSVEERVERKRQLLLKKQLDDRKARQKQLVKQSKKPSRLKSTGKAKEAAFEPAQINIVKPLPKANQNQALTAQGEAQLLGDEKYELLPLN